MFAYKRRESKQLRLYIFHIKVKNLRNAVVLRVTTWGDYCECCLIIVTYIYNYVKILSVS